MRFGWRLPLVLLLAATVTASAGPIGLAAQSGREAQPRAALSNTHPSTAAAFELEVEPNGRYALRSQAPDWTFGGDIGHALSNIRPIDGADDLGAFHEVVFDFLDGTRSASIRAYQATPSVVFTSGYDSGGQNAEPFPVLSVVPKLPYSLAYHATPFSPYQLNSLESAADSPWLFFDASGNGFLISPATDFPLARLVQGRDGSLTSGIDPAVARLPPGYTHQTLLTVGTGPNRLFDTWGAAMTALHHKVRPANDADLTLEKFGYWTDNGAAYYYHFEPELGYAGTLLGVTRDFEQRGIRLGYLQLDSWWYPKGPAQRWDDRASGIFRYRAAPDLFPNGLAAFQQQVGVPLVTHARWIDPTSPYRTEFSQGVSGNVMTDAGYWSELMSYLQSGGVVTFEQDWLGAQAQPVYDLSAPTQFMGNMASAAAQRGITLQYCMPLPRHVLQTVEYANVTSMRVSDDRFDRNRWDTFLYTSRLASALGVWPWADVFFSTERDNLLLADLSGGVVGVGDALGATDTGNIRRVMRADAVLIKPDAPLVPTDESILAEAADGGPHTPMVAWTYSDHPGGQRALYLFAYARGDGPQTATFTPASLGVGGPTYVLDVFGDTGRVVGAGEAFTASVTSDRYFVVAPVGPSGIALLGDAGAFVSLGRKRISQVADDGTLTAAVEFAAGEETVVLQGIAPGAPLVAAAGGSVDGPTYDPATQRFRMAVHPDAASSSVRVSLSAQPTAEP